MKFRALVAFVLAVFWSVMSYAQDPPQPPQKPLARISGRVVAADSGKPIRWAVVRAASPQGRQLYTVTDEQGRFELKELIAGTYRLDVRAERYLPIQFGGFPYDGRAAVPKPIDLKADEHFDRADFALPRGAAIEGRVLDEFGDPAPGITVQVSRLEYVVGRRRLIPVGGRTRMQPTDDRGHFRVFGLQAGDYYLSALSGVFTDQNESAGFVPTYYPGTSDAASAQRIRLGYGAELVDVVLQLIPAKMARIGGRLVDANGHPVSPGMVLLTVNDRLRISDFFFTRVVTGPDGTFAFRNVPPGRYQIRARGEAASGGTALYATFTIAVDGRDIDGLTLTLSPGASLDGSLSVEAVSAPRPLSFAGVRVRAPFADGTSFGDSITGDVGPDGAYRIRGLMAGSHVIALEGLRPPWLLKSVTYRGQDITDLTFDVEGGQEMRDVRITITDAATDLSGVVRDAGGRETADAIVLLIPSSPQFWTRMSRRFGLVRTDAGGRYRIRGLPAGEYRALATSDIDEGDATRRDLLQEFVGRAVPISLRDRERRALDLTLVSLAAARRTAVR
jgi:hypothetical protein